MQRGLSDYGEGNIQLIYQFLISNHNTSMGHSNPVKYPFIEFRRNGQCY